MKQQTSTDLVAAETALNQIVDQVNGLQAQAAQLVSENGGNSGGVALTGSVDHVTTPTAPPNPTNTAAGVTTTVKPTTTLTPTTLTYCQLNPNAPPCTVSHATAPGAPQDVKASNPVWDGVPPCSTQDVWSTSASVTITWSAASDGGAAISKYTSRAEDPAANCQQSSHVRSQAVPAPTGLAPGSSVLLHAYAYVNPC